MRLVMMEVAGRSVMRLVTEAEYAALVAARAAEAAAQG